METTINSFWQRNKIIFKGLLIGILILILLIPTVMLEDLVDERQNRQQQAIAEVSSKWAGHQVISGPVIAVPYWQVVKDYQGTVTRVKHQSYFLPDKLSINANVVPEKRYRGIYQVMVYTS
ncbi:MAG TPA: inner membrane CreD family protein, partial [Chitinophagaceae bacterium]